MTDMGSDAREALDAILEAMESLDDEARQRVLATTVRFYGLEAAIDGD